MAKPESIFLVTYILDGDCPARNRFVWTLKEALEYVARLSHMASVNVSELHPVMGTRQVLKFAPDGLIATGPYETHDQRWKPGYSQEFLASLMFQPYPGPLRSPWDKG